MEGAKDKEGRRVVVIAGASSNPERHSNKAARALLDAGWRIAPVNPAGGELFGAAVVKSLKEAPREPYAITFYVNAKISSGMLDEILALKPGRAVFNPGAENPELMAKLAEAGIETVEGCTLVMLKTGRF